MSYQGVTIRIPMAISGLRTDDSDPITPVTSLTLANNVTFERGLVMKDFGSRKWLNTTSFPNGVASSSPVVGLFDWEPSDVRQYFVAVTRSGKVYRFLDSQTREEIAPTASDTSTPSTLTIEENVSFAVGGTEDTNRNRKLFVYTGNAPIQVISGDSAVRANITTPAADWTSSYPTHGLIHNNRHITFGNKNDPHRLYISDTDDHEKFAGGNSNTFSVFPGKGIGIKSAMTFRGRLFIFKYPRGVYVLDDSDPSITNWTITELTDAFGIASEHSAVQIQDDILIKNTTGSLTSLSAANTFGDIESADILNRLRVERYLNEQMSPNGTRFSHMIYYEDKRKLYVTYQSAGGTTNDRLLVMDFSSAQEPRISIATKDTPLCLSQRRDQFGVLRPFYGSSDGHIYEMDVMDRSYNGSGYLGEFQTPNIDFSHADARIGELRKNFDFLEVTFEETGNWNLSVDVFIDREYQETITFNLTKGHYLDSFPLNTAEAIDRPTQSVRKPLHGSGRRISFKCYNSGNLQNFKIASLGVSFRIAEEGQKA